MFFVEKLAILGTGLLGASLARALKKRGLVKNISAWSRSAQTRAKCAKLTDVFNEVCESPTEAVRNANIVVMCVPTANIPELAREISQTLDDGAILTDVGSVKSDICEECAETIKSSKADFVGSHPMAGSEKIGPDFSDADLFEGRPCFVIKSNCKSKTSVEIITEMWKSVGMQVYNVSASEHDAIVARVSHLPHLLAGTLCVASSKYNEELRKYVGPGFRDTTRVASGSPDIWDSIVFDNREEILKALKDYSVELNALINDIEKIDKSAMGTRLRSAKIFRDSIK